MPVDSQPSKEPRFSYPTYLSVVAGVLVIIAAPSVTTAQAPPNMMIAQARARTPTNPAGAPLTGDEVKVTKDMVGCRSQAALLDVLLQDPELMKDPEDATNLYTRENCRMLTAGTTGIVATRQLLAMACVRPTGEANCLWTDDAGLTTTKRSKH